LDDELSPFQRAILERHLKRCAACATYARTVVGATEFLRAQPLEEFRLPDLQLRVRRRAGLVVRSSVATAAVAAVGIWLAVSFAGAPRTPRPSASFVRPPSVAGAAMNDSRAWAAGLPRVKETIQLIPGGLRTGGIGP
jgi:hypothetical protein